MCSHVYCLSPPSCYLIIVSVAPAVSPSLPSFVSPYSLLVSAVLCWSVVFRVSLLESVCLTVHQSSACLPACFLPLWVVFVLLFHFYYIKHLISSAFESSTSSFTWQNGPAKMRTQQTRGLGRSPPATISSPLYQRILQYEALSSCRQQGNDVRRFALEFSGAAEGLGYNDEALKDLFNSALDEPLSWWRMSGLDHLIFGEFVKSSARSPAKVAGVPQVVGDKAVAPPVVADGAALALMAAVKAAAHPRMPRQVRKLEDLPMRSVWAADFSPMKSSPVVLEAMVAITESAPEPAPPREPIEFAPEPAPPLEPMESAPEPAPFREPTYSAPVREPTHSDPVREPTHSAPVLEPTESAPEPVPFREPMQSTPVLDPTPFREPTESAPFWEPTESVPEPAPFREPMESVPFREPAESAPFRELTQSPPLREPTESPPELAVVQEPTESAPCWEPTQSAPFREPIPGVPSRAPSGPGAHRVRSRARSDLWAHAVHSGPGPRSGNLQSPLQGQPHPGTPVCPLLQALFHFTGLAHPPPRHFSV